MPYRLSEIRQEVLAQLHLGLPLILAQILMVSMGFIDTVMVGRLGAMHLAAIAIGSSFWVLIFLACIGLLMGLSPIISQLFGAAKKHKISQHFQQSIWLSIIIGTLAILCMQNIGALMRLMNVDPEVVPIASDYLFAVSWGMPAICLFQVGRYFNEAIGNSRPILVLQIIYIPIGVLGNYIFIYGHYGAPAMGATGAGVATAIAQWISVGLMYFYLLRYRRFRSFQLFRYFRAPDWTIIRDMLKLGIPISTTHVMEVGLFTTVAMLMGSLGATELAAHQVAINYAALMFMVPLGLSMAISVRVGQAVGAGRRDLVRMRGFAGTVLGGVLMLISAAIMLWIPEQIIAIYTDDPSVNAIAMSLLFAAALFQVSDGLQVCGLGALRGLKDVKTPMLINLVSYWLFGLPIAWYLGIYIAPHPPGLWYGLVLGLSVAALLLNIRFFWLTLPQSTNT